MNTSLHKPETQQGHRPGEPETPPEIQPDDPTLPPEMPPDRPLEVPDSPVPESPPGAPPEFPPDGSLEGGQALTIAAFPRIQERLQGTSGDAPSRIGIL